MENWKDWRRRAKEWKADHEIDDAYISASVGKKRATINSWLNKREPNLADFMALCEAMGADPGLILFGHPVLGDAVPATSQARVFISHAGAPNKLRSFKLKKRRLRRVV